MEFSYTAKLAIESRKQTILEELNKLKNKIDEFDIEKPQISMISINMKIENLNRLSIAVSTIENIDGLHTAFSTNPIYGYAKEPAVDVAT